MSSSSPSPAIRPTIWRVLVLLPIVIAASVVLARYGADYFSSRPNFQAKGDLPPIEMTSAQALQDQLRADPNPVKLVNIWATWCKPCIEEMPYILNVRNEMKDQGLSVYLVSADINTDKDRAAAFLASLDVDFITYMKDDEDNAFIDQMSPDWTGALPATFLYDQQGRLVNFWMGEATEQEFREAVVQVLQSQNL